MECEDNTILRARLIPNLEVSPRKPCCCLKTSEKLKQILKTFPEPSPPLLHRAPAPIPRNLPPGSCVPLFAPTYSYRTNHDRTRVIVKASPETQLNNVQNTSGCWLFVGKMAKFVQLSVTAAALLLYYCLYCYMQLVHFTLMTAVFFHKADRQMKVTLSAVALTTILLGINLVLRTERLLGYKS